MKLLELGKNPISEQEPAGTDVRFDPDFEALSQEIEKFSSPTASGGIDWQHIAELSKRILGQQSKDLLVACYLCIALLHTEQLRGLAQGIHILRDMLEDFWDTMFPAKKRMKGRVNALTWWKEKVETSISTLESETWPKEEREDLLGDLNAINDFLGDNMEDAPLLHSLIDRIDSLVAEAQAQPVGPSPIEEKAPPAEKQEAITPPDQRPTGISRPLEPSQDMGPKELLEKAMGLLEKASSIFMDQDIFHPMVYRLNRIVAWSTVDSLPPSDSSKTMLPPPEGQIITALNNLYRSGSWKDLLESAESHINEFLFWLDLSRYSAEALEQLGRPEIGDLIADDAWFYTKRLPGLEKLCFSDGMAFADEETREWLRKQGETEAGGTQAWASSLVDSTEQIVENKLAEAEEKIKKNKLAEALVALRDHMGRAVSVRERFLWQMGMCRLLVWAKKSPIALPYIDEILALLDEYKVEKWEPVLAAKALEVVLSGLRAQGKEGDDDLKEKTIKRLSFVDPIKAMEYT